MFGRDEHAEWIYRNHAIRQHIYRRMERYDMDNISEACYRGQIRQGSDSSQFVKYKCIVVIRNVINIIFHHRTQWKSTKK
jgi:hypothetical protein